MTWLNWHAPSITPAQFAYCVIGWLVIEALLWIFRRVIAEGKVDPEGHEMLPPKWEER